MVNVLWGFLNLVIGYLLICRVGSFDLRKNQHVLALGAGVLTMALTLAHTFDDFTGVVKFMSLGNWSGPEVSRVRASWQFA